MPLRASVLPRCPHIYDVEQDRVAITHLREGRADETLVRYQDEGRTEVADPSLAESPRHRRRSLVRHGDAHL
eukprot:1537681-Alexandrium_andersonii.AAC.1